MFGATYVLNRSKKKFFQDNKCCGTVGIIFAFQPQGPGFVPLICRDLNIIVTFFAKAHSAFYLIRLVNTAPAQLVSHPGAVKDPLRLNTTEAGWPTRVLKDLVSFNLPRNDSCNEQRKEEKKDIRLRLYNII